MDVICVMCGFGEFVLINCDGSWCVWLLRERKEIEFFCFFQFDVLFFLSLMHREIAHFVSDKL